MLDTDTGEFISLQSALAGRYSLERELGRGGMGIVYLARDVALDRLVALKLLPPRFAADPSLRERFVREARIAAKLSHPNIIPIFAVDSAGEFVFFVMAFVDGETLGQRVRSRGPMPPSELARVLREVAWGLAYAHAQGVVHRDVKADNILLERGSGRALVADFGIARATQSTGATGVGELLGTAEYMSPEQASGEAVDHRSDIYSLGVVAFYALAGRLPFDGPTVASVLAKQITQPAPPVAQACEGVPSKLAFAVDRCLAKDPAARFATAEDLADAVAAALEARRELPVPMRVFIKKSRQLIRTTAGVAFFEAYFVVLGVAMVLRGPSGARIGALVMASLMALLGAIPVGALLAQVRALLKAGYGRGELVVAWKAELEREREERAFEFGRGPNLVERVFRWATAIGFSTALAGAAVSALMGPVGKYVAGILFGIGLPLGILSGLITLLRHERRTDLGGRWMGRLLSSHFGRWTFTLASFGLKRSAIAAPPTHRPTELAIGMAVDALFEALSKPARRHIGDLPKVVRGLENDAMKMRRQVDKLNDVVARIEAGTRTTTAHAGDDADMASRRAALDRDLHKARDAAQERLADAVTALETIRLDLLRLTAGAGSVDSLTADLAAARGVSEDVDRLLEGQREVEAVVKGSSA